VFADTANGRIRAFLYEYCGATRIPSLAAGEAGELGGRVLKTYSMKKAEIAKEWLVVDAAGVSLGRLATQIATLLRGKHKPTFTPHLDMGDSVIVINAGRVKLTGLKSEQKTYERFSGYLGGRKEIPIRKMLETHPEFVVTHAVRGMMPKTKLARQQLKHLRVYQGAEHPHEAQQPRAYELPDVS
jgi:large subunit ribosomal protein L13